MAKIYKLSTTFVAGLQQGWLALLHIIIDRTDVKKPKPEGWAAFLLTA